MVDPNARTGVANPLPEAWLPHSLLLVLLIVLLAFPCPAGAVGESTPHFREEHVDPDFIAWELSGRAESAIGGAMGGDWRPPGGGHTPVTDGSLRERIAFFRAYARYGRGNAIVRANTTGDPAGTRRALELFTAAMELVSTLVDREDFDLEGLHFSGVGSAWVGSTMS